MKMLWVLIALAIAVIAIFLYYQSGDWPRSDSALGSVDALAKEIFKEVDQFRTMLGNMSDEEIAYMLIWVTHIGHFLKSSGYDVDDPIRLNRQKPESVFELRDIGVSLHQRGDMDQAWAVGVWTNTLKAASMVDSRPLAKGIWDELQRGIPMVPDLLPEAESRSTQSLNIEGYRDRPKGF